MKRTAGIILGLSVFFFSGQLLPAEDRPASTVSKESLQYLDRITQNGITWTFDGKVPVGRFVNGDYYVVGGATVISISPRPENGRNGSGLNLPPFWWKCGFDQRGRQGRYDPALRAYPPILMKPGDSLVSTISVEKIGDLPGPLRPSDKAISPVRIAAVLTCLPKAVPAYAFRPSYCDREQKIFLAQDFRQDLLLRLPRVEGGMEQGPREIIPEDWADRF